MVARAALPNKAVDIETQSDPRSLSLKSICALGEVHVAWLGHSDCVIASLALEQPAQKVDICHKETNKPHGGA